MTPSEPPESSGPSIYERLGLHPTRLSPAPRRPGVAPPPRSFWAKYIAAAVIGAAFVALYLLLPSGGMNRRIASATSEDQRRMDLQQAQIQMLQQRVDMLEIRIKAMQQMPSEEVIAGVRSADNNTASTDGAARKQP